MILLLFFRKQKKGCLCFGRKRNNIDKEQGKNYLDNTTKLAPYNAYSPEPTRMSQHNGNILNITPTRMGQHNGNILNTTTSTISYAEVNDTAALIGLNIANGKVHSISIGSNNSNPRVSNGHVTQYESTGMSTFCPDLSTPITKPVTYQSDSEPIRRVLTYPEHSQPIKKDVINMQHSNGDDGYDSFYYPHINSHTNLVPSEHSEDEQSIYSQTSEEEGPNHKPYLTGHHINDFMNSFPKTNKVFQLSPTDTIYPDKSRRSLPPDKELRKAPPGSASVPAKTLSLGSVQSMPSGSSHKEPPLSHQKERFPVIKSVVLPTTGESDLHNSSSLPGVHSRDSGGINPLYKDTHDNTQHIPHPAMPNVTSNNIMFALAQNTTETRV